ncbi:MAG: HPr family phosphocarrier protein [Lachnospiraceae bacterium]
MKQFNYCVKDELGIHARPAGLLVKEAAKYSSNIKLGVKGKEVDAKRIMGVMGLGAKKGDDVKVFVDGADEDVAMKALQSFFQSNL